MALAVGRYFRTVTISVRYIASLKASSALLKASSTTKSMRSAFVTSATIEEILLHMTVVVCVYALPLGWARVALDTRRAEALKAFDNWHPLYHGTTVDVVEGILATGSLAKAGDTVVGGTTVGVRGRHIKEPFNRRNKHTGKQEIFDPNQIFLSPSIKYAGNPDVYAKQVQWQDPTTKAKYLVQVAFHVRVRPGAKGGCTCKTCKAQWSEAGGAGCKIGPETLAGTAGPIDPIFDNSELEWYTKDEEKGDIICTGLLVRMEPLGSGAKAGSTRKGEARRGSGGDGGRGEKRSRGSVDEDM
jgi:hypothetical protein